MGDSVVTATVLALKFYPTEEISVKLNGRPIVITLRNVKIRVSDLPYEQIERPGSYTTRLQTMRDIHEGMPLALHDIGVWNVNTTAFHGGTVCLDAGRVSSSDKNHSIEDTKVCLTGPTVLSSAVLPKRRKYSPMSLV